MSNLSSLITQTVGSSAGGVNLITAPSSASIWTGTGGVTVTTTTTAAELPLEGFSSTAVKFALSASTGTAYCDFDCPTALQNFLLQLLWYSRASSAFTASITLSINSYSSSSNRTSNTSPTVVTPQVSAIIGAGINFETNFVSTSNQYLRLTLSFGAQASAWYSIAQFGIGPSNRTQGPAIADPISWTPTGSWTTNATYSGFYRRIGSSAEFTVKIALAGAPTGGNLAAVNLPTGMTINTSVLSIPAGGDTAFVGSVNFTDSGVASYVGVVAVINGTTTSVRPYWTDDSAIGIQVFTTSASAPFVWGSADYLTLNFTVPIAEWAGSGTVNLGAGAQVEYAYNTDVSSTATVTGSGFASGPAGIQYSASWTTNTAWTRTVQWQYPIQDDDMLELQVYSAATSTWVRHSDLYGDYTRQNTRDYGPRLIYRSTTQTDVLFCEGGFRSSGVAFGDVGAVWSGLTNTKWRVRKAKASSPVGFGLAGTDGSAGLYKPGSAPGLIPTSTTITAAPLAGYIGETLEASGGTLGSTSIGSTGANTSICGVTLTPGVWEVQGGFYLVAGATTAWTTATWAISSTNNAIDSLSKGGAGQSYGLQTICPVNQAFLATTGTRRFNVTTNTPVYLVGSIIYTVLGGASYSASDYIKAVRIA